MATFNNYFTNFNFTMKNFSDKLQLLFVYKMNENSLFKLGQKKEGNICNFFASHETAFCKQTKILFSQKSREYYNETGSAHRSLGWV